MIILVMRPSPAGEQLVSRLAARGETAYHWPLIDFSPGKDLVKLPQAFAQLHAGDVVMMLSQQAVNYADATFKEEGIGWPQQLSYYAIGRTTARLMARATGVNVVYPDGREISESLLSLPALQQVAGRQVVLMRGNGGRELLASTLAHRGALVHEYQCYQRCPVHYNGSEQSAHWQRANVDTLVVTSGEMLQQLYALVPESDRTAWLLRCCLIVVSERLASLAHTLGWQQIRVADNADNDALIRALQ